jgi:hypothetical protein
MTKKPRSRTMQTMPLADRLLQLAEAARAKAIVLPPGAEREKWLRKAHEAERAAQIERLLLTPGADLQP